VHRFSTAHLHMQTSVNFNNLVMLTQRKSYGVQIFKKLLFCYLEHLDSLRLGHEQ